MIYQRFGQGVSNLSTVAELRTFDGTWYTGTRYKQYSGSGSGRRYRGVTYYTAGLGYLKVKCGLSALSTPTGENGTIPLLSLTSDTIKSVQL